MKRIYGTRKQTNDPRDFKFVPMVEKAQLESISLFDTKNTPPVYDQGQLGSCTANAAGALFNFALMNKPGSYNPEAELYNPSRLFIYYFSRLLDGNTSEDSGATLRNTFKAINLWGAPQEKVWDYDIMQFAEYPSDEAVQKGKKFAAIKYHSVRQTRQDIVNALHSGFPVAFGFEVYSSFESSEVARTGKVPMPSRFDALLGGHAVAIWGYRHEGDYFLVRNSWGTDWGINGYFHMPAQYVCDPSLAFDFWTLTDAR